MNNNDNTSAMELGRRERQILSFVYRQGQATAAEVHEGISDAPSYSGVRAMLRILEEKGHLSHSREGAKYVYKPTVPLEEAGKSAMNYLVNSFFGGSTQQAIAALLDGEEDHFSNSELESLTKLIDKAAESGR